MTSWGSFNKIMRGYKKAGKGSGFDDDISTTTTTTAAPPPMMNYPPAPPRPLGNYKSSKLRSKGIWD